MRKVTWFYRLQQLIILLAHLVLLKWILFTLNNSGHWSFEKVTLNFIGIGLMGAGLIYGCAQWARYHYMREHRKS